MSETYSDLAAAAKAEADRIITAIRGLDAEQKQIIHDTVLRRTQLLVLAIGATESANTQIANERRALDATLATLGEEKAAQVIPRLDAFVWSLISRAIGIALVAV